MAYVSFDCRVDAKYEDDKNWKKVPVDDSCSLAQAAWIEETTAQSKGNATCSSSTTLDTYHNYYTYFYHSECSWPDPTPANSAPYTVQKGDTLGRIAARFRETHHLTVDQLDWEDIQKANQLQNPDTLEVGQVLQVPIQK